MARTVGAEWQDHVIASFAAIGLLYFLLLLVSRFILATPFSTLFFILVLGYAPYQTWYKRERLTTWERVFSIIVGLYMWLTTVIPFLSGFILGFILGVTNTTAIPS
jgi:hypothetical protein